VSASQNVSDVPRGNSYFEPPRAPTWGKLENMFVIELTYTAGLSAIDAHMAAHVSFLKKYYAAGKFLVSGRKIPRDGGIIIATARDRDEIERIIREDPFHKHGLADFRVIEFRASQRATDFPKRVDA
jgi:uncharacterized protein YciI